MEKDLVVLFQGKISLCDALKTHHDVVQGTTMKDKDDGESTQTKNDVDEQGQK